MEAHGMKQYILALDQGTTSSRSLVFDHGGRILGMAQQEFTQHFPQPGWVEHDPEDILSGQLATAREAVSKAGLTMADIAAVGITNQRETTVVWDRATGKAIHNAIVWQDRRTADFCDELRADGQAADIRQRTGLEIDAYFSGTKVRWILDHVAGARERAARGELAFGTIDSWLIWHLTGGTVHATDASNASRTLLYNLHDLRWDPAMLDLLQRARLPCCPKCDKAVATLAGPPRFRPTPLPPSRGSPATSSPRSLASSARHRAWSKTLTARAVSCS